MIYSLLLVAVVGSLVLWYQRWKKTPEAERSRFGKQSVLWALIIVILVLVMTGRAHWLMGVLAALLALAARVAQFAQYVPLFKKIFDDVNAKESGNNHQAPSNQDMTRQQAADFLGVDLNASPEEIRLAHKKLMQKIHPDRGGSDALAKQINRAKDIMLT